MIKDPRNVHPEVARRQQVNALRRGQKVEYRLKLRANIIWHLFYEQRAVQEVAHEVGVHPKTVRKWRDRFQAYGVPGLEDAPRAGRPSQISVTQRCEILAIACDTPENYGLKEQPLWTYDTLTEVVKDRVDDLSISRSGVYRTLQSVALKPHKTQMWLHSPDPNFKAKVNEIVGLYEADWPDDVVVVCIDEKTGMQANERKYATEVPRIGRAGRVEYEYIRHGTVSLLAAFNIRTGEVFAECRDHRTAADLVEFMEGLAKHYVKARKIIVIWDNLNIHYDGPSERWTQFNARHRNKFEFHYTPIHASWVNQAEVFFSVLEKGVLRQRSFTSTDHLSHRVMAFIQRWNTEEGHPFNWTFRGYPIQDKAG